jgi:hypothetical protein
MSLFDAPWGNYLLNDIIETSQPESISWWPQTLGWQLLFLFSTFYLLVKGYRRYKKYIANAYRREAIAWIEALPVYQVSKPEVIFRQLPAILRKTAISAFSRAEVSLLSKDNWELWLDNQCQGSRFTSHCSNLLYRLSYQADHQLSTEQMMLLQTDILHWIKFHRGQYA